MKILLVEDDEILSDTINGGYYDARNDRQTR